MQPGTQATITGSGFGATQVVATVASGSVTGVVRIQQAFTGQQAA